MAELEVAFQHYPHTYHQTASAYLLPNSSPEQKRLASQAAALKALVGGDVIHTVNLQDSPDVCFLDIGCGTGTVTYDIAHRYPSAKVYGIDLSPIQVLDRKPSNVEFINGDLFELAGDRLQTTSFDFIFSRLLQCAMTDWNRYLRTVVSLLKPGARCEFHDVTWEYSRDGERIDLNWKWMQAARAGAEKLGLDLDCGKHIAEYAHAAGLIDITQKFYAIPAGTWVTESNPQAEAMGIESERNEIGFHLIAHKKMYDQMQYSEKERKNFDDECARTLAAERKGRYKPFIVTTARKPE